MARRRRVTIPNSAHYVTQRSAESTPIFREPRDYFVYLRLLRMYSQRRSLRVLAYCLLPNEVHHVVVPLESKSLRWTFQLSHKLYADHFNMGKGEKGRVWKERFYSIPLDNDFLWVAIRRVEQLAQQQALVESAEEYPWSSARGHCQLERDELLSTEFPGESQISVGSDWRKWLAEQEDVTRKSKLEKALEKELPCGSMEYLGAIQQEYGIQVHARPVGRPRKKDQQSTAHLSRLTG